MLELKIAPNVYTFSSTNSGQKVNTFSSMLDNLEALKYKVFDFWNYRFFSMLFYMYHLGNLIMFYQILYYM